MKFLYRIVLGIFLLAGVGFGPAWAQKRVALVIGNSNYQLISSLANPQNDAELMASTLEKLGFEVFLATNVDARAMSRVVRKFGKKLRAVGKDGVGLFYYAGHGVSARGTNYLIPLGAEIETESDLEIESISAASILSQMVDARTSLNLVILDACRNNPYKGAVRSAASGLSRITTASGSLIAFSAAPGQVAADGSGINSPYTTALVSAMQVPGVAIEQMFKKVRVAVESSTGGLQSPWEESSLRGDFYFAPAIGSQTQPPLAQAQALPPAIDKNTAAQAETLFWTSVKDSQDPQAFAAYLEAYPNGIFAGLAKVMMNNLLNISAATNPQTAPSRRALASLQPAVTPEPVPVPVLEPPVTRQQRVLDLQRALKRVGCDPGGIDGKWGRKGRRALASFKRFARLDLHYDDLSDQVLAAVRQQRARICPAPVRASKTTAKSAKPTLKTKSKGTRTYGRRKTTKEEWQTCIIESMAPNPIVEASEC